MRLREAVASGLHLLVVLSFITMAFFAFLLPIRPDWRLSGVNFLESTPEKFYWIGAALGFFGFLLLLGFYKIGRGKFLRLEMKPHLATIDVKLIEEMIEECFQKNFPNHVRSADIAVISKERLEIALDLIPLEEKKQLRLMHDMEKKLSFLLQSRFGYSRPFTLSVHSRN